MGLITRIFLSTNIFLPSSIYNKVVNHNIFQYNYLIRYFINVIVKHICINKFTRLLKYNITKLMALCYVICKQKNHHIYKSHENMINMLCNLHSTWNKKIKKQFNYIFVMFLKINLWNTIEIKYNIYFDDGFLNDFRSEEKTAYKL